MFQMKAFVVAAAAVLASVSASAVTIAPVTITAFPQGPQTAPSVDFIGSKSVGAFLSVEHDFSFTITNDAFLNIILDSQSSSVTVRRRPTSPPITTTTGLTSFSAALDGNALTSSSSVSMVNGSPVTSTVLNLSPYFLAAGSSHLLKVFATGGSNGGSYDNLKLTFAAAMVPEPETYALMLAGLAGLGFVARRRKS